MTDHIADFPFEEMRNPNGDYFDTIAEVEAAGYSLNQIWSVVVNEDTWTYGPSHHYVNLIGYTATRETHDGDTYYHVELDFEDDEFHFGQD